MIFEILYVENLFDALLSNASDFFSAANELAAYKLFESNAICGGGGGDVDIGRSGGSMDGVGDGPISSRSRSRSRSASGREAVGGGVPSSTMTAGAVLELGTGRSTSE